MVEFSRTLGSQIGNMMKYLLANKIAKTKNKTNP